MLATTRAHPMEVHLLRLTPGQDLKLALDAFAQERKIAAGVVLTCVGSLSRAALRLAAGPQTRIFEKKYEIVSLVGTLSTAGSHLHASLADGQGAGMGGHLKEGCLIFTTAEIAIGVVSSARMVRKPDAKTGYDELELEE